MVLKADAILKILGYEVMSDGRVMPSPTQIAVVTIEETSDGGVLMIQGSNNSFFYDNQEIDENHYIPEKLTKKFVYFSAPGKETVKVLKKEFSERLVEAMAAYDAISLKKFAG